MGQGRQQSVLCMPLSRHHLDLLADDDRLDCVTTESHGVSHGETQRRTPAVSGPSVNLCAFSVTLCVQRGSPLGGAQRLRRRQIRCLDRRLQPRDTPDDQRGCETAKQGRWRHHSGPAPDDSVDGRHEDAQADGPSTADTAQQQRLTEKLTP